MCGCLPGLSANVKVLALRVWHVERQKPAWWWVSSLKEIYCQAFARKNPGNIFLISISSHLFVLFIVGKCLWLERL